MAAKSTVLTVSEALGVGDEGDWTLAAIAARVSLRPEYRGIPIRVVADDGGDVSEPYMDGSPSHDSISFDNRKGRDPSSRDPKLGKLTPGPSKGRNVRKPQRHKW